MICKSQTASHNTALDTCYECNVWW